VWPVWKRIASVIACVIAIVGFLVLIWPTPYLIVRDSRGQVYRVNRFTGVRQESTSKGWRTKEQIQSEFWEQQAQEQAANQRREAEEKAARQKRMDQVFEDLSKVTVNGSRNELNKIIVSNPTSWDLEGASYNTTVEYYTRISGTEEFLAKRQSTNSYLKAYGVYSFDLGETTSGLPDEVVSLPPGKAFSEKIFIQFDRAINRNTGERIDLRPAFVWKHQRAWTMPPPPE